MLQSKRLAQFLVVFAFAALGGCEEASSTSSSDTQQTSPDAQTSDAPDTSSTAQDTFEATDTPVTQPDIPHDSDEDFPDFPTTANDAQDTQDTTDTTTAVFVLSVSPSHLPLPYAQTADPAPEATLYVQSAGNSGSEGFLEVLVQGPFVVTGDVSPLGDRESRPLTVQFTGDMSLIQGAQGTVTINVDGQSQTITLAAAVGRPGLPLGAWRSTLNGAEATLHLPTAPFPHPSDVYTDDSVLVFVPQALGALEPPGIVTHFHGHNALLSVTVPGQYIVEQFAHAGRDAVLIIPQGPVQAADSGFGKLEDQDGLANLTQDVMSVLYRDGLSPWATYQDTVLTSHSGGYQGTASAILVGGSPVIAAHLFDSLYARETTYRDFVIAGGVLRSSYTSGGGTDDNNATLRTMLQGAGITPSSSFHDDDLAANTATIGFTPASHSGSMWVERAYARFLVESGLKPLVDAPPEWRAALSLDEDTVLASWRPERTGSFVTRVEGSVDGVTWEVLGETENVELEIPHRPWLRLVRVSAGDIVGLPSDVYGATGDAWLVVDGFDRVLGGSWEEGTHDFAARVGVALGRPFSVVSNEAVERGEVDLGRFGHVVWLLGDESTSDVTFSQAERLALDAYLASGGRLLVSGSEVGYATDGGWLGSGLGVGYVSDDAGTTTAGGFAFGSVYEEDYPDVLSGAVTLWAYSTGGGAAIGWENRVVVVGFGLETMSQDVLEAALPELVGWLEQ